jgi:transcriptional regulator with XRE-family HTH domain
MDVKALFGRRLKSLRKRRKLTQESLGKLAKLDYKHIWSMEKGLNAPSFDAIGKLAKALHVEPFEFFLPDRLSTGKMDQGLQQIVTDFHKLDAATIKTFFSDMLSALQKMESGK